MFSTDFLSQHRKSEKDFTRNRSLTFPRLISFMLNMVNGSIQSELSRFFQIVDDSPVAINSVTTAAFCKARKKLSYTAFKALNSCLIDTFYDSSHVRLWNGYRLLAVDGSVTHPSRTPELLEYFGKARSHAIRPAVRISQLYDVLNKLSINVQIDPYSTGERTQAVQHLEYTQKNDLVLYDRGYPAVWFYILHQVKNVNFCARVTLNSSNALKEFLRSGKNEDTVFLPCVDKSFKYCQDENLPTSSVKVRLIRITLPSGQTEILATSLVDKKIYPYAIFKDLYFQRWGVEEDYKLMKSRLTIENFSGTSVEAVMQDIHAKVLTKNIAAIAIFEADKVKDKKYEHRKYQYRINFTYALSQLKDNVVRFLLYSSSLNLSGLLIAKIATIVDAYRPDRSFIRIDKRETRNRFRYNMAYKRVG
ncbi:MAG: IS4 family transposase [Gammaproteobacteria bacterium]|nr:IS4 family transposase [Gammaproteobacteria bacterium]